MAYIADRRVNTAGPDCISNDGSSAMTNHISIQVENDDQYERLQEIREKYGVTWKGLLIQGAFHLERLDTATEEDDEQ